jgi:hypothetical protein
VADVASDPIEDLAARLSVGSGRERGVARRGLSTANELGEVVDVRQTQLVRRIFGICGALADRRDVRGAEAVGDPHLVQIGVRHEGEHGRLLIFPAETPYASGSRTLQNWNLNGFSVNLAIAHGGLISGDHEQRLIVHRLYESITQCIERRRFAVMV